MLHYETTGTGPETLVLLHGLMQNSTMWAEMLPGLSEKFRLIKIDLPGHGRSPMSAEVHTVELMAAKVQQVVAHLGLEDFHLLGHSMGGYTALAYAEKYPEMLKSLTLFFSTYLPDSEEKKETRRKSFRLIREEFERYVSASVPLAFNPYTLDEMEDKVALSKKLALETGSEASLATIKGIMERPDRRHILEEFAGKVLLLNGRHDNAVDSIETIQALPQKPNIKSYLLDCGHNGHWEQPVVSSTIINEELLSGFEGN